MFGRSLTESLSYARIVTSAAAGTAALLLSASADAAPINYGDFSDVPPGSVMYLDVTETANSPGDTEPLFGAPTVLADTIDFMPDPARFGADNSTGEADQTQGLLRFGLSGDRVAAITRLDIGGSGMYDLIGPGSATVEYEVALVSATVSEVDGMPVSSPVVLPNASRSGKDELIDGEGEEDATPWNLSLSYDVSAALAASGVSFDSGATSMVIELELTLAASGDTVATGAIGADGFFVRSTTEMVPEPASASLLGALGVARLIRRRRPGN